MSCATRVEHAEDRGRRDHQARVRGRSIDGILSLVCALTLAVFVPFAFLYMQEPLRLNFVWAALCLCGAVFFIFRG